MMGDKVLGALGHPREIADAQLVSRGKRRGDRQSRRVRQRLCLRREPVCEVTVEALQPQPFGLLEIKTQQITAIVAHSYTLTYVVTSGRRCTPQIAPAATAMPTTTRMTPPRRSLLRSTRSPTRAPSSSPASDMATLTMPMITAATTKETL